MRGPQKYSYEEHKWPSEIGGMDQFVVVFKTPVLLAAVIERRSNGSNVYLTYKQRATAFSGRARVESYLQENQTEASNWPVMVYDKHLRETVT